MLNSPFHNSLLSHFGLTPNDDQRVLFEELEVFLRAPHPKALFILSGYAGTGKTSVLGAYVRTLSEYKIRTRLLAPTGRAAKVLSRRAGEGAFTIHKQIYRRKSSVDPGSPVGLAPNLNKHTVFIVDESSMIGDYTIEKEGTIGARNLLADLMEYVYSGEGCRLILLGDEGQLPPVGSDHSPALNPEYMKNHYPTVQLTFFRLTKVLRQAENSMVLFNATLLRNTQWESYPKFVLKEGGDLIRINGSELQDALESSYANFGVDDTIVITRSNKNANKYNLQIRGRILWYEEELCAGDCLMAVKNNYFWQDDESQMGFIANGELLRIRRFLHEEEIYGFRFAKVLAEFPDYPNAGEQELIINLEALAVEGPSLSRSRMKELFFEVEKDYYHLKNKKERYDAILKNPYFNALQVKYAYAVTCHKSQGGQWHDVYIDQGYLTEEMLGEDYFRWLYTALTRATGKVYLVNFDDSFFQDPE